MDLVKICRVKTMVASGMASYWVAREWSSLVCVFVSRMSYFLGASDIPKRSCASMVLVQMSHVLGRLPCDPEWGRMSSVAECLGRTKGDEAGGGRVQ